MQICIKYLCICIFANSLIFLYHPNHPRLIYKPVLVAQLGHFRTCDKAIARLVIKALDGAKAHGFVYILIYVLDYVLECLRLTV